MIVAVAVLLVAAGATACWHLAKADRQCLGCRRKFATVNERERHERICCVD